MRKPRAGQTVEEIAAGIERETREKAARLFQSPAQAQEFLGLVNQFQEEADVKEWREKRDRAAEHSNETRARRHTSRAAELASIRRKLANSEESYERGAAELVIGHEDKQLPAAQYQQLRNRVDAAVTLIDADEKLAKVQQRHQAAARVLAELGPYDEGSPHSWVADWLTHADPGSTGLFAGRMGLSDMSASAVEGRLRKHGEDMARAVRLRSEYGQRIAGMLREGRRQEDKTQHQRLAREEIRAFTTGGGATASASGGGGAAFVPPAILLERWAAYRSEYRAFADQCTPEPLPDYGMGVYIPQVTTGSTVTTQTEGSAVREGVPVTGFITGAVVQKAGSILVSQQYLDRAGPGIAGDAVLYEQIHNQFDAQIGAYAINQALAGAQAVTNNGSFALTTASGVGGFLGDLKKGKSKLTDTAGVRLRGTHCFATSDVCDYVGSYADAQGRPAFSPTFDDNRLPIRVGDEAAEGFTGYVLVGLALFADDNIPNVGTTSTTQAIVARPETILLLEGAAIPYVFPPTVAGSLEAVLGVRAYVATIPRFPSGVASISGTAYTASTFA